MRLSPRRLRLIAIACGIPVDPEDLRADAEQRRCVAPVAQGSIDHPACSPGSVEHRREQHRQVVLRVGFEHADSEGLKHNTPSGGRGEVATWSERG